MLSLIRQLPCCFSFILQADFADYCVSPAHARILPILAVRLSSVYSRDADGRTIISTDAVSLTSVGLAARSRGGTFDSLNESSGSIEVLLALDESVVQRTDGAFEIETIRESAAA